MNTETNRTLDIDELVSEISNLISLPEVYLKIRGLMDDPHSVLDDFTAVVNTDPGLLAVVLKIVNSAFFGFSGQIGDINRALNLIGIGQLHDLVLSLSAVGSMDLPNEIEALQVFWQRNIYCGVVSQLLAKKLKLQDAESLFVIGLLHEIGRLLLFLVHPKQSKQIIDLALAENRPLATLEREVFGADYGKVGQVLMAEWKLPLKFQSITEQHVEPGNATEYTDETAILHVAHQVAVNKFPGADSFQTELDEGLLAIIKTTEEEMNDLYEQADELSREMENLVLGNASS
jgi:HD-like signal output (HDOD) protein